MPVLGVPPPNPHTPEGMAFVFAAGMVDPRPGKTLADRQPCMIIQSWAPTSKLLWDLGLRFHPEKATKWLKGGGQFSVAEILDEPPEDLTVEGAAEQVLEMLAGQNPEYADTIKKLRDEGSPEQKKAALRQFQDQIKDIVKLAEYVKGQTE